MLLPGRMARSGSLTRRGRAGPGRSGSATLLAGVARHVKLHRQVATAARRWLSLCFRRNVYPDSAAPDPAIALGSKASSGLRREQYAKTYFEWMRNIMDWLHLAPAVVGPIGFRPGMALRAPKYYRVRTTRGVRTAAAGRIEPKRSDRFPEEPPWVPDLVPRLLPLLLIGWAGAPAPIWLLLSDPLCWSPASTYLFFWVARMIMLGCHFMLEERWPTAASASLKDAVPFPRGVIHLLVRDADRQEDVQNQGQT